MAAPRLRRIFVAWSRGLLPVGRKHGIQSDIRLKLILSDLDRTLLDEESQAFLGAQMTLAATLQGPDAQKAIKSLSADITEHFRRVRREPSDGNTYGGSEIGDLKESFELLQKSEIGPDLVKYSDWDDNRNATI